MAQLPRSAKGSQPATASAAEQPLGAALNSWISAPGSPCTRGCSGGPGGGAARSPKMQRSFAWRLSWDWEAWDGRVIGLKFKKRTKQTEVLPFKYRKSPVAFIFSLAAVRNRILQFRPNVEFQPLFLCGILSVGVQYFLITVYCVSRWH